MVRVISPTECFEATPHRSVCSVAAMRLEAEGLIRIFGVFLIVCSRTAFGWRSFKVIFTSFPFQSKADVVDVRVDIKNATDETTLSVVITVKADIDDIYLHYAIGLEGNDGNFSAMINRSVNFCNFLKERKLEPVLHTIYEDLLKHSNLMKACPIRKGRYALLDYHLDEEMLPSFVPETSFYVDMRLVLRNGEMLFDGRLHGRIDKSKGFNNLKMFSLG